MRVAYNVIRPLLDVGARANILFLPEPADLRNYLPPDSLPTFVGGNLRVDFGPDIDLEADWAGVDVSAAAAAAAAGRASAAT